MPLSQSLDSLDRLTLGERPNYQKVEILCFPLLFISDDALEVTHLFPRDAFYTYTFLSLQQKLGVDE